MSDNPAPGWPADNEAGITQDRGDPAATTEHLRRLWQAGARDITVTYDDRAERHRSYLLRARPDSR